MIIKKTTGEITEINDLTKTAKEIKISLSEPVEFIAGHFVNVFIEIDGEKVRRAYSISSSDSESGKISLAIRLSPQGKMTPLFWSKSLVGEKIDLMGPLGLNSAEKMKHEKIFLFAFGIGAGVVRSLAEHFKNSDQVKELIIVTGSRFQDEIVYKEYFDSLATENSKVKVIHVVSRPLEDSSFKKGYIQDNIENYSFNNSDVYICGQNSACEALVEKIKTKNPQDYSLFIEAFH